VAKLLDGIIWREFAFADLFEQSSNRFRIEWHGWRLGYHLARLILGI
jgi:hypothetical protein